MSRGQCVKPRQPCCVEGCTAGAVFGADRCVTHLPHNLRHFSKTMYRFKNSELQSAFELMLRADDRLSLDNELALMRTCLQSVVAKADAKKIEDLGPHATAAITSLAAEVARTCDIVARIEQKYSSHVPLEVMFFFVQLISDTLVKTIGEEQAAEAVGAILELPLPTDDGLMSPDPYARRRTLGRGTVDPSMTNSATVGSLLEDRQAKIKELRAQARELRDEIQNAGITLDEELAPNEPEDEK